MAVLTAAHSSKVFWERLLDRARQYNASFQDRCRRCGPCSSFGRRMPIIAKSASQCRRVGQECVAPHHGTGVDRSLQMLVCEQGQGVSGIQICQRAELDERTAAFSSGTCEEFRSFASAGGSGTGQLQPGRGIRATDVRAAGRTRHQRPQSLARG